jgi:hypothetical protein
MLPSKKVLTQTRRTTQISSSYLLASKVTIQ